MKQKKKNSNNKNWLQRNDNGKKLSLNAFVVKLFENVIGRGDAMKRFFFTLFTINGRVNAFEVHSRFLKCQRCVPRPGTQVFLFQPYAAKFVQLA